MIKMLEKAGFSDCEYKEKSSGVTAKKIIKKRN
jgi:hypothetical protein